MVALGEMVEAWTAPEGLPVAVVATASRDGVQDGSCFVLRERVAGEVAQWCNDRSSVCLGAVAVRLGLRDGWLRDVEDPAPVDAVREVPRDARMERMYLAGQIDFLTLCEHYGLER